MLSFVTLLFTLVVSLLAAPVTHQSGGEEYTVVFNNSHPLLPTVDAILSRLALSPNHPDVIHIYNNSAFRGFSASMKTHCLDLLANMTEVSVVERAVSVSSTVDSRVNAPWGLQRISTASSSSYFTPSSADDDAANPVLNYTYSFANSNLGQGADIYVLDTGIYAKHVVFGGRASMIWSFDNNYTIEDGHGTHVAGIAGGDVFGVASKANLFGVKTLNGDGSGWSSDVIAGIDLALRQHQNRSRDPDFVGSVMSMSLEASGTVAAIDSAVSAAAAQGLHAVVAAGNSGTDACTASPASAGGPDGAAITVGSVGLAGSISTFSNTGACVDVYAPGESVLSAWLGGPNVVKALSGTSMATPHVTGIVAYAMAGNATLARSPQLMKEWVVGTALRGLVRAGKGTVKGDRALLANNGVRDGQGMEDGLLGLRTRRRAAAAAAAAV